MIQVFCVKMEIEVEALVQAQKYLTPERRAKALRFRYLNSQYMATLTGLLERYVLETFIGLEKTTRINSISEDCSEKIQDSWFVIEKGSEGKPYLRDYPHIHYNLSHAGNYVVCAIGDQELGIDIEECERYSEKVVNRFFREQEKNDILGRDTEEERKAVFADYWVMKESFMKLSGAGFAVPVNTFDCDTRTGRITVTDEVPEKWREEFVNLGMDQEHYPICSFLPIEQGYRLAICTWGNAEPVKVVNCTAEELIVYFESKGE